ncbi:MAG TPA: DUF4396 domain-containing protein [Isosphaeraceae bacterium]|jgi:hypothetical protein
MPESIPGWLETIASISLALAALCALVIAIDILAGRRQVMQVMNLVWPITALYLGPIGLWAYWTMGRPDARTNQHAGIPGMDHATAGHGRSKPLWRSVFVATSHCGAGCVVGDLIGEALVAGTGLTWFGSPMLTTFAVVFVLSYLVGLGFQFFAIAPMRNLGLRDGLIAAIKADTVSLLAFEVGMFGWMLVLRALPVALPMGPRSLVYWFLMQIAMIVGFLTSYPANWWLVTHGIKEAT